MVITLPRWNHPDAYYSQENNAVESMLKKSSAPSGWLETCGPTAAVTILDALGANIDIMTPGGWKPQPEDLLTLYLNDPRNERDLIMTRNNLRPDSIMGNRVPQYYQAAIPAVFGVPCRFEFGINPSLIIAALRAGRGLVLCMVKPGHYIAVVGYDTETNETIYHDPWQGNRWPARYAGKPGRLRRVTDSELAENFQGYRIEIG